MVPLLLWTVLWTVFTWGVAATVAVAIRWWWKRVHGGAPSAQTAAWLALASPTAIIGSMPLLLLPDFRLIRANADLLIWGGMLLWSIAAVIGAGRKGTVRERLSPMGIAWLPWIAWTAVLLGSDVHFVLNPDGREIKLGPPIFTMLWLFMVYWGLRPAQGRRPVVSGALVAVTDVDGIFRFEAHLRPLQTSLALTVLSMVVWPLAAILAVRPELRGGRNVVVRVCGEEVEITEGGRVPIRLSVANGQVLRDESPLGAPVLTLIGRGGTATLALEDCSSPQVEVLAARLETATRAKAVTQFPVPSALRRLRQQANGEAAT